MALLLPATQDVCATVVEELAFMGGTVSDSFDDGQRLFLRAILPLSDEVRPHDVVEGGVAVKTAGQEIEVCPYLFRQVCRNGAVMAQVAETRRIRRVDFAAPSDAVEAVSDELREAVHDCSAAGVFARAAWQLRSATSTEVPRDVSDLLMLLSFRRTISASLQGEIVQRFLQAGDRSAFGLMNAVTSVARDQEDPQVRWRLEELGGGVPAMKLPRVRPDGFAAELAVSEA
jgi:hypothetical protein